MKYLFLLIATFALGLGACERHSWEDQKDENGIVTEKGTKNLFTKHGTDGGGHGAAAHDKDGASDDKNGEAHDKDGVEHTGGAEAEH